MGNYLLDPESGAWLEPPGPPSTSSGLSPGLWTGHHGQLGMTIGEGVQELLPGGRGSNNISNSSVPYQAPAGQLDCRNYFCGISASKDDTNFFLWDCGEPTNGRGGKLTNLEERSPLDDAGHHHHQLISSSSSDTGVLKPSQSS